MFSSSPETLILRPPQPTDKLVQPVTYLAANKHRLAVFDSRDLKKGFPVFVQRKFPLPAAYTTLKEECLPLFLLAIAGARMELRLVLQTLPVLYFRNHSRMIPWAVSMPPSDGSMNDMSVPVIASPFLFGQFLLLPYIFDFNRFYSLVSVRTLARCREQRKCV